MAQNAIPDHVKAKAMEATAKVRQDIKPLPDVGAIRSQPAPREWAPRAQQKIAEMGKSGKDAGEITKAASKDNFGKY